MSHVVRELLLGTRNRKKAGELRELLGPFGFRLATLQDYPQAMEIAETGDTFTANARLKAVQQALHLGRWVVGEDSGLCVEALDGAPGVVSARFSGPGATDARNNARLLEMLRGVPLDRRTAYYVCHVALADPQGQIRAESEATCAGRILFEPVGSGGFGYDPLFEIVEYHRTFGELSEMVKAALSHRARAIRLFVPQVLRLVATEEWQVTDS